MAIEQGSMRQVFNNVYQLLINDEQLMRLMFYYPKDSDYLDPLDTELDDILGKENYWDIVADRIMLAEKHSDLIDKAICRIYITQGQRRPVFGSYFLVTQEIMICIFTHEKYEADARNAWISDRVNELIALEYIEGTLTHRMEYKAGNPYSAPPEYKRYNHIYVYSTGKK